MRKDSWAGDLPWEGHGLGIFSAGYGNKKRDSSKSYISKNTMSKIIKLFLCSLISKCTIKIQKCVFKVASLTQLTSISIAQ